MKEKIKDFWNNIDWGHTAIGGGAGALGGLLFNRFLLGNRTWRSHAIASAIGAALGGGGTALYEHLDRKNKKKLGDSGITPAREEELMEYEKRRKNPTPGDKLVSAVNNSMGGRPVAYGATGGIVGKAIEGAAAKAAGRRSDTVLIPDGNGKITAVPVQYAKMDKLKLFHGSLSNEAISKLSPFERAYLLSEADRLGIKVNQEQLTNPGGFGLNTPLPVSSQGGLKQRKDLLEAHKVVLDPISARIKEAKDRITNAKAIKKNTKNKRALGAVIKEISKANKELAEAQEAYRAAESRNRIIDNQVSRINNTYSRPTTALGWFKRGLKSVLRPKNSLPVIGAGLGAWDTYRVLKEESKLKRDLDLYRNKYKKD